MLLSGHHAYIAAWRTERSIDRTLKYRPELLAGAVLDKKAKRYAAQAVAAKEAESAKSASEEEKP